MLKPILSAENTMENAVLVREDKWINNTFLASNKLYNVKKSKVGYS